MMRVVFKRLMKARSIFLLSFVLAVLLVKDSLLLIRIVRERDASSIKYMFFPKGNRSVITARKLLLSADDGDMNGGIGTSCSKDDIGIYQGQVDPLPSGIPCYSVQIINTCAKDDCNIANIHVHCGWFSSARLINPSVFRRVGYDDCLVNDGQALGPGSAISFQYANTYSYPLSVSSVDC
ncbi:hypothetical protein RIF29_08257 [Crotalaria pallida]|uniref:TPD1 protein homolog 1-like n=1 Tax=Crotalaria pallida TaxID=3830 RepID=A0AAN9PBW1_CROPI